MRIMLSLIVLAACGKVNFDAANTAQPPPPSDVDAPSSPAADAPSAPPMADAAPPGQCPPIHVADAELPVWFTNGGLNLGTDPAGSGAPAWVTSGTAIKTTAFVVPTIPGDRLTGLTIDSYGNGGLGTINVVYQPDAVSSYVILAQTKDTGHGAAWGAITFPGFQAATLSPTGIIYVSFVVAQGGYYVGKVTPQIDRPCR